MRKIVCVNLAAVFLLLHIVGQTQNMLTAASVDSTEDDLLDAEFEIEYSRYLKEVSSVLDTDKGFQKSIGGGDVQTDELEGHLKYASKESRSKLDELKRIELRRLKDFHKQAMKLASDANKKDVRAGGRPSKKALPKPDLGHVDLNNPGTFGAADLHKLIMQTTLQMANIDKLRKKNFKRHELHKAYNYKTKFRDLTPEEQRAKLNEHLEKAKAHPKINHPGGREQLKEVWEKVDKMDYSNFDPKVFFMLHDIDNDGLLNPAEIEALFDRELNKIFNTSDASVDPAERDEDMNRMREHVFTEVDTDRDGMINWEEFKATVGATNAEDEGWESVHDKRQFTDEELAKFEADLRVEKTP